MMYNRSIASMMKLVNIEDLKSSASASQFESGYSHHYPDSIMDNTKSFYLLNVGSIPARGARYNVSGASWTGTGLQIHGSRFDSYHSLQIVVDLQEVLMYNRCSSKVHSKSAVNTQCVAGMA